MRPDRIGDVVLSTPVFEALKRTYPESEIHVLVREATVPVVRHSPYLTRIITYRAQSVHKGIAGFFRLWKAIRREHYDIAIALQVQWSPSFAMFLSGVKFRIGPYSKWYSWIFFNKGIRQRRSLVTMHETDYNLKLLRKLGVRSPSRKYIPHIVVDADAKERMRTWIKEKNIPEEEPFVLIHPGMGGSALNWSEGYYIDLVKRLLHRKIQVVLGGSQAEKALLWRVDHAISGVELKDRPANFHVFMSELNDQGLSDYIALMSLAKTVVAPSTGPLHIATALGKSTVSFYPPIKVQSVLRWGPYVEDEEKHITLVPDAICGQDYKCLGPKCSFYFCMDRLSVQEALQSVLKLLGKTV